ncbi:MAG: hypothetical protein AAGI23_13440 [Bacteroidota bacterium]
MTTVEAFEQIASSLALLDPEKVAALSAPKTMADRVEELIYRKKDQLITSEENTELEKYLALDLLIGLAKARAKVLLYQS